MLAREIFTYLASHKILSGVIKKNSLGVDGNQFNQLCIGCTPAILSGMAIKDVSYEDLYRLWERGNWSADALDFSEDAVQWQENFTEFERKAALWNYALFFWGEDAVAEDLSPYIEAAPLSEQRYFLMTQQVDEARHAVFFKRFMYEVAGLGDGSIQEGLSAIQPQLTPGFTVIFARLRSLSAQLRRDHQATTLAQAICLYHLVVEATLAQPGQRMITRYLARRNVLSTFQEGLNHLMRNEGRHVAFGVKMLGDLARSDERVPSAVAQLLREVLPWTSQVLMPPGWDERYLTVFGCTFDSIGEDAINSLRARMRAAGLPLEDLPGPPVLLNGFSSEAVARRGREMAQAGILGVCEGPAKRDHATQAMFFDTISRQVDLRAAQDKALIVQFDFTDADVGTWHLIITRGEALAAEGYFPHPDIKLRASWQDFIDVVGGRLRPGRAFLTRRLRLSGRPQALWLASQVLPVR